jgi:hypothetical protein
MNPYHNRLKQLSTAPKAAPTHATTDIPDVSCRAKARRLRTQPQSAEALECEYKQVVCLCCRHIPERGPTDSGEKRELPPSRRVLSSALDISTVKGCARYAGQPIQMVENKIRANEAEGYPFGDAPGRSEANIGSESACPATDIAGHHSKNHGPKRKTPCCEMQRPRCWTLCEGPTGEPVVGRQPAQSRLCDRIARRDSPSS